MATAYTLKVEGGFFPAPALNNKFAGNKGMAIFSIMGSTGTNYTLTSTASMGLASVDGIVILGSDAKLADTGTTPAVQVVGEKIVFGSALTYNKKVYFGAIGKPVEPAQ